MISGLLVFIVLEPIWSKIDYHYLWFSTLGLVAGVQAFRLGLFFREYRFFRNRWFRALVAIVNIHLIVIIIARTHAIIADMENFDMNQFGVPHEKLSLDEQYHLFRYIGSSLKLIAVFAVMMLLFLIIRIVISYFRQSKVRLGDLPTTEHKPS